MRPMALGTLVSAWVHHCPIRHENVPPLNEITKALMCVGNSMAAKKRLMPMLNPIIHSEDIYGCSKLKANFLAIHTSQAGEGIQSRITTYR